MPVLSKAIKPSKLNIGAMIQALTDEAEAISKDMLLDFEVTTTGWEHQVKFEREISVGPKSIDILVATDDEIYTYVDKGTRPHLILPVNAKALRFQSGYKAKSVPNVITSNMSGGPFGDVVYSQGVQHPGTEARNFDETIKKKWEPEFKKRMQAAMKVAAKVSGHEI